MQSTYNMQSFFFFVLFFGNYASDGVICCGCDRKTEDGDDGEEKLRKDLKECSPT